MDVEGQAGGEQYDHQQKITHPVPRRASRSYEAFGLHSSLARSIRLAGPYLTTSCSSWQRRLPHNGVSVSAGNPFAGVHAQTPACQRHVPLRRGPDGPGPLESGALHTWRILLGLGNLCEPQRDVAASPEHGRGPIDAPIELLAVTEQPHPQFPPKSTHNPGQACLPLQSGWGLGYRLALPPSHRLTGAILMVIASGISK